MFINLERVKPYKKVKQIIWQKPSALKFPSRPEHQNAEKIIFLRAKENLKP